MTPTDNGTLTFSSYRQAVPLFCLQPDIITYFLGLHKTAKKLKQSADLFEYIRKLKFNSILLSHVTGRFKKV